MVTEPLRPNRRTVLAGLGAIAAVAPGAARALTVNEARTLIGRVLDEIMTVIHSGKPEEAMLNDFAAILARHADMNVIARSALGPPARSASPAQIQAFTAAFQHYMSRKYGRRFRELIGGRVEVTGAREVQSFFEVISIAHLVGEPPFEVRWHVSDRGGRHLFFNMIIEGVNVLTAEREEIGAMLDQRRGDVDRLIADLRAVR